MKYSKSKLILLLGIVTLILCCSITAYAAAGDPAKPDKILKYTVGSNTEKHELEHSGTDNLVNFTLPEEVNEDTNWVADYIEVMLMERLKGETEFEPMIKLNSSDEMRAIVEIEGMNITLNLGNSGNYRTGAQYQILYRVHMKNTNDESLVCWLIPTYDYVGSTDYSNMSDPDLGWTLLTNNGDKFIIYTNSDPTGEVSRLIKRETLNIKPAVEPSTLGGSPKVAITQSLGYLTMQARQHFHQPYAQDYRIYADNYSSISQGGVYKDVIRAYSADVGSTSRKYKWFVTGGSKLSSDIPLNRSAVVSTSNAAQPSTSRDITTNSSGWDGMFTGSGTASSYVMMDLVCNSGTQDAYTLTDIEYRINCGTENNSKVTSTMTNAMKNNLTGDDGYGNWAKTNKYLSGTILAKDEDDGDMLGFKILINGTSDSAIVYNNFEVYDSGPVIYPNTEFEYRVDLASKIASGCYKYVIYLYDDNGGEFEFENAATGGYITLLTRSEVDITASLTQAGQSNEVKWANERGSTEYTDYKTFTVGLNRDYLAKKLIGGNDNVKVRTQYTMYNAASNNLANRYMVSRSTMLGMNNTYSMGSYAIDKAYTKTVGSKWYSNYNTNADSNTVRLLSHANSWKHGGSEETTLYEDGLYSIVVSCNDIYGNYVEKVYGDKDTAIRIDGHKPEVTNVSGSVPMHSSYTDNASIDWVNMGVSGKALNVLASDTVATIGGVEYYSGIKEVSLDVQNVEGTNEGHVDNFKYNGNLDTAGDMSNISYESVMDLDAKDALPDVDGVYRLDFTAKDLAGNVSDTTSKFIGIDNTEPVIDPVNTAITDNGFEMIKNNDNTTILNRNPLVDYVTDWVDYVPNLKYGVHVHDGMSGISELYYSVSNEASSTTSAWEVVNLNGSKWLETETINRTGIANLDLGNCGAGVKYLHIKAIDRAGNEGYCVIKLKLNSIPTVDNLTVDDTSRSGIYKTLEAGVAPNGIKTYIVYKSADYSAFKVTVRDADVTDKIELKYTLTNNETGYVAINGTQVVDGPQNGSSGLEKAFMIEYQDVHGDDLPDGIYTLEVRYTDIKVDSDFDGIDPYNGEYKMAYRADSEVPTVQIVIKRKQPPLPQITVNTGTDDSGIDCKVVSIEYPLETGILNCPELNALILKKYSTSTRSGAAPFIDYTTEFYVYETTNVVAQYTDCAGNVSTNSLQVLMDGLPDPDTSVGIISGGSDVVVDENRASNTYYIGTRKESDAGIDSSKVFSFIN